MKKFLSFIAVVILFASATFSTVSCTSNWSPLSKKLTDLQIKDLEAFGGSIALGNDYNKKYKSSDWLSKYSKDWSVNNTLETLFNSKNPSVITKNSRFKANITGKEKVSDLETKDFGIEYITSKKTLNFKGMNNLTIPDLLTILNSGTDLNLFLQFIPDLKSIDLYSAINTLYSSISIIVKQVLKVITNVIGSSFSKLISLELDQVFKDNNFINNFINDFKYLTGQDIKDSYETNLITIATNFKNSITSTSPTSNDLNNILIGILALVNYVSQFNYLPNTGDGKVSFHMFDKSKYNSDIKSKVDNSKYKSTNWKNISSLLESIQNITNDKIGQPFAKILFVIFGDSNNQLKNDIKSKGLNNYWSKNTPIGKMMSALLKTFIIKLVHTRLIKLILNFDSIINFLHYTFYDLSENSYINDSINFYNNNLKIVFNRIVYFLSSLKKINSSFKKLLSDSKNDSNIYNEKYNAYLSSKASLDSSNKLIWNNTVSKSYNLIWNGSTNSKDSFIKTDIANFINNVEKYISPAKSKNITGNDANLQYLFNFLFNKKLIGYGDYVSVSNIISGLVDNGKGILPQLAQNGEKILSLLSNLSKPLIDKKAIKEAKDNFKKLTGKDIENDNYNILGIIKAYLQLKITNKEKNYKEINLEIFRILGLDENSKTIISGSVLDVINQNFKLDPPNDFIHILLSSLIDTFNKFGTIVTSYVDSLFYENDSLKVLENNNKETKFTFKYKNINNIEKTYTIMLIKNNNFYSFNME